MFHYHQVPVFVFFVVLGMGCLVKVVVDRRDPADVVPPRPAAYGALNSMGRYSSAIVDAPCPICFEKTKLD